MAEVRDDNYDVENEAQGRLMPEGETDIDSGARASKDDEDNHTHTVDVRAIAWYAAPR